MAQRERMKQPDGMMRALKHSLFYFPGPYESTNGIVFGCPRLAPATRIFACNINRILFCTYTPACSYRGLAAIRC